MEEKVYCFDCLQSRIKSDYSDKLSFNHGISVSALPLGSSAVVQVASTSGEASSAQFILVYVPNHEGNWLTQYVNQYILDNDNGSDNQGSHGITSSGLGQYQNEVSVGIPRDEFTTKDSDSRKDSLKISICKHSIGFSLLRTISALAPIAHLGISSSASSILEDVSTKFLTGSLEDHVLDSLTLLIKGKASGRDSINFLSLLGLPSFEEETFPGSLRHPNIAPVLAMIKTSRHINIVLPKTPFTLENILHYSPDALRSDWHIRFLIYQLLSALCYIHGFGLAHGNICPSNVMLTDSLWSWLRIWIKPVLEFDLTPRKSESDNLQPARIGCCVERCPSNSLYADLKISPSIDWHSSFNQWWRGELSNFEYLLILNRLAGRRWGDHTFHPVMPWVIDFSIKPDENSDAGWRDLSKSKWRLAKGDEQLDFTYSTSEIPHHVSDECLSELAVCSYKARRLPLSVLRMAVRSVYEPNEYPSTMQRLYQWSPDECIPEFYSDPQIFYSLHAGMTDLAVPTWANNPEEFIKLHRDALESNWVSRQLHHWIDITFGYKMSGEAAIAAKNVMLPLSESTTPRSVGRFQLFTRPHPIRRDSASRAPQSTNKSSMVHCKVNELETEISLLSATTYLQELEEASAFSEHARHLSAHYCYPPERIMREFSSVEESPTYTSNKSTCKPSLIGRNYGVPPNIDLNYLLQHIEEEMEGSTRYQELLLWRQKISCSRLLSEDIARDIFSVGCLLAELHLRRPIFDSTSLEMYLEDGSLPRLMQELPPDVRLLVEACIQKDCIRRPSAKIILESPYFPKTVKSSYLFLAPLQLLAKDGSRLHYAANFANQGALRAMGTFAAEMCCPYCLSLVMTSSSTDTEAEWAYMLLKEFIKCLRVQAVKTLVLPAIQKILQTTGYSHLKVSLLQDSFMQEIRNQVGKQAYLDSIHPLVLSNLYTSSHKSSAASASVLLISSSEELGVPITIHQTILPLVHCFGKGLCDDGIEVLVRIGGLFGESFIIKQMLPLLKHVVRSFIDVSWMNKPEPVQCWSSLALFNCLVTVDGLVTFLPEEVIVKELLGVSATTLLTICQRIGPELTALHVLPQLKELFDELAFSQEIVNGSATLRKSVKVAKPKSGGECQIESRMDLVLLLYPSFASLLGIEKLRRYCATWLLLEQFLLRRYNWKWEYTGESSKIGSENMTKRTAFGKGSTSEYSPAKLLLNGVGWSIPQSQGSRAAKNLMPQRQLYKVHQSPVDMREGMLDQMNHEPWFWCSNPAASWDGPEFLGRVGVLQNDDLPWKIRASVIYSVRAHHGAVRSLAVCQDESAVLTAGIGQGFKGTVQKWELSRMNCVSGYYGHEEVVNDICVLSSSERAASCDGTIHVWNSRTGKKISVFSESQVEPAHLASPLSLSKINIEQATLLNLNTLSNGILSSAFDGSLYTCMHQLEFAETLIVGTGNGSLRFIDVACGQKLHIWKGESVESAFPSLVSAICSSGFDKMQSGRVSTLPSFVAAGLSSGHCRLFDAKSGNVIASWRAHDGYVTKLAAPEDHLIVSSSLDRTLRVWDLRMNLPSHPITFKGHTDGISGFSMWGQDIISISKNRIGLLSLSKSTVEHGHHRIIPQKLYTADHGTRNLSAFTSIKILPYSRLFLIGTEDGYLRICC
ncbi:protein GFS12 isoform X1 [Quillaja saponaria]|uniref:Protein GFS12 isoform X1 n=1 Tax=Quillaja saponaria TaxID=32244 RepID=A0AAD7LC34_QUISA|nr:protein GFS12 isoform X1 [Quillaja saponaria]